MSIIIISTILTILLTGTGVGLFIYYGLYPYIALIALAPILYYLFSVILLLIYFSLLLMSKNLKFSYSLIRPLAVWVSKSIFHYKVKGYNVPKKMPNYPIALVGNHKSKIDPLFLIEALKHPISFTPKQELYKSFVLRTIFKKLKSIKIYRDDIRKTVESLNEGVKNIKENKINYVIFPEGGTQNRDTEKIKDTKKASYKIIKSTETAILPFTIKGGLTYKKRGRSVLKIYFHDIIPYNVIKDMSTQEIGEYVEPIINSAFYNKNHQE